MARRSMRVIAIAAALVAPQTGTALAAGSAHQAVTPADDTYGGGGVLGGNAGGAGGVLGGSTGGLPFTGANLLLILGSGAALAGAGVGLRAVARRA
jgi:hypothetical protein